MPEHRRVIHAPEALQPAENFRRFLEEHVSAQIGVPIDDIIDMLSVNFVSDSTRRSVIRRGNILVERNRLSNDAASGRDIRALFDDENLGRIRVTFLARLAADFAGTRSGYSLDFSARPVPVELFAFDPDPHIGRFQLLLKMTYENGARATFRFRDQTDPDKTLLLILTYVQEKFFEEVRSLTRDAEHLKAARSTDSFFALLLSDNGCSKAVGSCPDDEDPNSGTRWEVNRSSSSGKCVVQKNTAASSIGITLSTHDTCAEAQQWMQQNMTDDAGDTSKCLRD